MIRETPSRLSLGIIAIVFLILLGLDLYQRYVDPFVFTSRQDVDVFILMGQSNMAGRGKILPEDKKPTEQIYRLGPDFELEKAVQPLHRDRRFAGFSLGIPFAQKIVADVSDRRVILLPLAVGGTSLERWTSGGDLFARAVIIARYASRLGTLKAVLWHQGENEASGRHGDAPVGYAARLQGMIRDFRRAVDSPGLPFLMGTLGDYLEQSGQYPYLQQVNAAIRQVASQTPSVYLVEASDLSSKPDNIHFNRKALITLAERYHDVYQNIGKTRY